MLTEQFSMIAFTAALEPLRLANRAAGRKLYEWHLYSADGLTAEASNGVRVNVEQSFRDAPNMDAVVVCAGVDVQLIDHRDLISVVRRLTKSGAAPGAVCTGTYVLAKAGLLDGYRCTIHWENRPGIRADFPDLDIGEELFEIDRDRFTCAGGVAAADMMLSLIKRDHGETVSSAVTDQLIHHRIREASERQRMDLRTRLGVADPKLLRVISLMERSIERVLTIEEFARSVALSPRQLERLFLKHLGSSPNRHYIKIRLDHACQLLRQTRMPILDVGMASGFSSASYFSQSYSDHFGHSPSSERKAAV
ncbi:GlxA family transcriptional regulator [Devosia psychrophila]|uniref:AraC family transcriptional regulator n=1 Tax=Devosia psychrophila TaxID=728005 RepID=A0A0F5PUP2_9HYPH|nr:GlxA family transcriptional regulator [Devosia psychrophila]KKC32432.1 AraC family transcriptional regulator [Devosia psychrophila]SFC13038.1 Transcriptional regulator GlxA family, contains an amidase domain and an AraC-type DNA-binding HTH domain [Devosia psychrophila]